MRALSYQPALDGLRALCLFSVLFFHSDFSWMSGGFLGVSTFFTLSGFLITSLLIAEQDRTGRVSLTDFWDRRLRRLAPATVVAVAGVVVAAPWWLPLAQQERLAVDAIAALTYLVNWRFVQAEYAYELIFVDPSPLQHFWSLAIEAQFYLLFPLLVGVLLRLGGGTRGLAAFLIALTGVSVALSFVPQVADQGQFRLYYGSDTRAAEILIGAVAALALQRARTPEPSELPAWASVLALPALTVLVLCWVFAGVEDAWLYHGGFAVYALASALVVVAATGPTLVRTLLSAGWLRWVGRVSYGAYLYHWPVFLLLDETRTGLGAVALLVVRMGVTLGLAEVSSRWLEEPIRRRRALRGRSFQVAMVGSLAAVGFAALLWSPISLEHRFAELRSSDQPSRRVRPGDVRWAVFGDSTAIKVAQGLRRWVREREGHLWVKGGVRLGCGLLSGGEYFNAGKWRQVDKCGHPPRLWRSRVELLDVDVAIILIGPWESRDWRLSPDGPTLHLTDPRFDEFVRATIEETMDGLAAAGATQVWLMAPHFGVPPDRDPSLSEYRETISEPKRIDRLNEIIREAAAGREGVHLVDLGGWVARWPGGEFDLALRPDRTHFGTEGGMTAVRQFLGPEILRIADGRRPPS